MPASLESMFRFLTRRYGDRMTDRFLRASGLLALLAILVSSVVPDVAALVPFALITVWTNGPHSPVLPASHEPALMLYGLLYPPVLIGAIGTIGIVFVEAINYHAYSHAADLRAFQGLRKGRLVTGLTRMFERSPFFTIIVCAVTPVPFWVARVLSVLARYSVPKHLAAIAIGRFPRLWFIAALGRGLHIPDAWLMGITVGSIVLALGVVAARHLVSRHRHRTESNEPPAVATAAVAQSALT